MTWAATQKAAASLFTTDEALKKFPVYSKTTCSLCTVDISHGAWEPHQDQHRCLLLCLSSCSVMVENNQFIRHQSPQEGGVAQRSGPWWPDLRALEAAWSSDPGPPRTDGSYLKKPMFSPKSTALPTLQTVGSRDLSVRPGPCGVGLTEQRVTRRARGGVWPAGGGPREEGEEKRGKDQALRWPGAQRAPHSVSPRPRRQALPPGRVTGAGGRWSLIGSRRCRSWCRAGRPPRPPGRWPAAGPGPRWSAGTWGTRSGS